MNSDIFALLLVNKLSTHITSWPFSSRYLHKCLPKNPAPPVTSILMLKMHVSPQDMSPYCLCHTFFRQTDKRICLQSRAINSRHLSAESRDYGPCQPLP